MGGSASSSTACSVSHSGSVLGAMSQDASSGWNALGPLGGLAGAAFGGISCGLFHKCPRPKPPTAVEANFQNRIVANALFSAINSCEGSSNVGQRLTDNCGGEPIDFPDNDGCTTCTVVKEALIRNREALEMDAANINPSYQIQTRTGNTEAQWSGAGQATFPCRYSCLSCIFSTVSQDENLHMDTDCSTSLKSTNNLTNELKMSTSQLLKSKQDVLGLLGGFLGADSQECITNDLSNRLNSKITSDVIDQVVSNITPTQSISVTAGSNSVYVNKFSQGMNLTTLSGIVSRTNVTTNVYNQVEAQEAQSLYYSNDTIDELAKDLGGIAVGFAQVLNTLIGRMLFILGILLLTFVIAIVGILFARPSIAEKFGISLTR